ncbi:NAD(P)-dependent oxidoreductase [Rhodococcus sp. DMU1]|uniref:NAD(P)-dependent oxidoreductase n=1 Tax=Rhodococcus sp. DMU1 TaxID=2722825 RepID=UPI00143E6040|nr:NAD(P)-dependent oxidoreductase [Rhodococcus sp. DMU1]QIX52653.1 NAD(P)-dependent oxidoreductase [Rhodococcus sp. DMU1]
MRVGFIGLGSQGGPMARRIVESGFPTTLWARRADALEPYAGTAAGIASSPAKLGAASDVVCVCVVADADVRQVVTGEDGVLAGMAPGGVLVVHSTIHPDTCRELAEAARKQGVSVVDAPVSGGGGAAAENRLLVMVGGEAADVERCRPVFETYGNPVVHLGGLGSGQVAKLLNNLLFTANLATAAGTLDLGRSLGVDPARLGEVITHGTANSFALGRVVSAGGTLDRIAGHAGPLLRKDVSLVAGLAESASAVPGVVLTTADAALDMMGQTR